MITIDPFIILFAGAFVLVFIAALAFIVLIDMIFGERTDA